MKNDNGLLINDDGTCVGYLFNFAGHGIYSPDGKIDITLEEVETHNKLLSQAEILGLDNAKIDENGTLYFIKGRVQTFIGEIVSERVELSPTKKSITFYRKGRTFRGVLQRDADYFNFRRIA